MAKFELDTIYGGGELAVVARTDSKVIFIRYGTEFLTGKIFLKGDTECTEIYGKIIKADENAIHFAIDESDIKAYINIAKENDDLTDELKNIVWLLEKRLFDKQLNSCPECGGEVKFRKVGMGFSFICSKCGKKWRAGNFVKDKGRRFEIIEEAIEKWNNGERS